MAASPAFRILDTSYGDRVLPLYVNAGAPTNGVLGTGTFAGAAAIGALLEDSTNGALYINTGTQASPVWTIFGTGGTGTYAGTFSGVVVATVDAAVTAIGTTAANSYALVKQWTEVTTAASTAVGITLPASTAGALYRVSYLSGTAASIKVWPTGTDQIDAGGAGANQVITKTKTIDFICFVAGLWESHALGAVTS